MSVDGHGRVAAVRQEHRQDAAGTQEQSMSCFLCLTLIRVQGLTTRTSGTSRALTSANGTGYAPVST